jgi:diguanylate cyclase (GGDEF)-like protein/PAS domain S-box-containing protein
MGAPDRTMGGTDPAGDVDADWIFASLPIPAVVCDLGGAVRSANDAFSAYAGVPVNPGTHWRNLLVPEDCERVAAAAGAALDDDLRGRRQDREVTVTFRRPRGGTARADLRLRIAATGHERLLVVTVHDVGERHRQQQRVAASEQRLRMLAAAVPVGLVSAHAGMRANYANERCAELFGAEIDDLVGFGWMGHLHPDDREAMTEALEAVVGDCVDRELEVRILRRGEPLPMRVRLVPVQAGPDTGYVASFEAAGEPDGDTLAELTSELRTDPLTGLANRRMLWETLTAITENEFALPAACFVDLDDFKRINDRFGHDGGDAVLRTVAERLRTACRDGDLVCRFGGDEFVVLLPHAVSDEIALTVGRRIVATIARPMPVGDEQLELSVSVGVVWTGTPGVDVSGDGSELLRAADVALYKAKRLGKNRAALFDEATSGEGVARREAIEALRSILDGAAPTTVHFRPIVPVPAADAPAPEPHDGMDLVEAFVPVGAGSGAREPDWVCELAAEAGVAPAWELHVLLAAATALDERSGTATRLIVAVSPSSLVNEDFMAGISALATGQPVAVAVTERVVAAADGRALEGLRRLRAAGVQVVLRGAGGPGSSFATLRVVPHDLLEVDPLLVEAVAGDQSAAATVAGLSAFAAGCGAGVVAAGVRPGELEPFLAGLGVTRVSGADWYPTPA